MVNMETAEAADTGIGSEEDRIRDVWNHNLEEEFKNICRVVQVWIIQLKFLLLISTRFVAQEYPNVALDTEFPGVVARPIGEFKSNADFQYQLLR